MSLPTFGREYRLPTASGVDSLRLTTGPVDAPKAFEVLVKVHAVSLNYRDLIVAKGIHRLGQKSNLIPCSDMAGEIIALGEDVKDWSIGDRVCANFAVDHVFGVMSPELRGSALGGPIDGVLAEYKVLPAHSLVHVPAHLSYEEASALPCAGVTAYNALMGPVPLKGGDYVLIEGTGGVSIFGLQLAVSSGATVIATSSSDSKLQIAAKLGAKHLINYKTTPGWEEGVLKITGGRGVDHVIEVGGPSTLTKAVRSVCSGGWIHIIGYIGGPNGDISSLPTEVLNKAAFVRGVLVGPRTQFEAMNQLLSATELRPVIDKVFPFEDARAAYEYLATQQHVGKVVITVFTE